VREKAWVLLAVLLCACSETEIPTRAPRQRPRIIATPSVPADWRLEAPLGVRSLARCEPDNILSEQMYWNKREVVMDFLIQIAAGKHTAELRAVKPDTEFSRKLARHYQLCIEASTFAEPPHYPYEFTLSVRVPAKRTAT
jgi:hypothetical protein